jgi:uncharacterized RDD family membrane protein YckC
MPCIHHLDVRENLNRCSRCRRFFCPDCLVTLQAALLCAECKTEQVKDIQSGVDRSRLQIAGFWPRFAAQLIDNMVLNVVVMPVMVVLVVIMGTSRPSEDTILVFFFVVYALLIGGMLCYHGFFLQKKGQTLGKMALKLKVVTPEGNPISAGQAWVRVITWFFLSGCLIDYIPALFTEEKTCLHDMIAKTRVVKLSS